MLFADLMEAWKSVVSTARSFCFLVQRFIPELLSVAPGRDGLRLCMCTYLLQDRLK